MKPLYVILQQPLQDIRRLPHVMYFDGFALILADNGWHNLTRQILGITVNANRIKIKVLKDENHYADVFKIIK